VSAASANERQPDVYNFRQIAIPSWWVSDLRPTGPFLARRATSTENRSQLEMMSSGLNPQAHLLCREGVGRGQRRARSRGRSARGPRPRRQPTEIACADERQRVRRGISGSIEPQTIAVTGRSYRLKDHAAVAGKDEKNKMAKSKPNERSTAELPS
jgi:hypothetical protein